MADSYSEYDEENTTRVANFAQEYIPAVPVPVVDDAPVDEDRKDADVLDYTQDIRRAILDNVRDGKGGIQNDKDLMAIAIATTRDMDAQALKKRGQRQKAELERQNGNVAHTVQQVTKRLIEQGVHARAPSKLLTAPRRDLDNIELPPPRKLMPGEFDDTRSESSAEFFARMEANGQT